MASEESKSGASATCHMSVCVSLQEFFVNFAPEIVQLQKKNLRDVVNCSQAKKHKEWKRAQNFYIRHAASLTVEEKELLEDWQLILCDVSSLESVALLPRLQRCFQRVDAFLKEHAEALKKNSARNLDTALGSRHMLQFPMSTFTRLFLGKFEKQLETEQVRALSTWQEHLCVPSAAQQEAIAAKRKKAVLDIQNFLVNFAPEIVQLHKKNLRDVVNCSQAKKHKEWKRAQNFYIRHAASLTVEEKELLEDWQLILCDVSSLESVALLPGLQRCFQRVDAFLKEHAEALKKNSARNLDTALGSRHMLQFPMSTFTRLFLGKFEKQLETKQVRALSTWQEHLCVPSAAQQEAIAAKRKKAVLDIQNFLVNFAPEIAQLQKKNLRGVVYCNQANKHKEWKRAQNFYIRHAASLTVEEKDLLEDWELLLCDVSTLESVALLPGLQRCFQRVDSFLREHAEALKRIAAKDLDRALRSPGMTQFPMSTFTRLFLGKFEKQLETEQVRALSTWQEHLCVPSAAEQEATAAKRKKAVLDIQDFLVNFAPEIVQLQKKNLRGVVYCNQANKHKEWNRAKNYFVRQYASFTFEEKELLEDWQLILCDVSSLESVALLPGLQRCFQRVDTFLKEHAEALKKILLGI